MTSWYCKDLGDAMLADPELERIRALARAAHARAGDDAFAVFARHESEGQLHCRVRVYFSPAAAGLARAEDAAPCARPALNGLDLLAGTPAAT